MLRSVAARRERRRFHSQSALRCVSKHEGKTESLVLILRDARTRVRIRGAFSTYALLRTRTSIACCKAHHTNSPSRCRGTRWLVRSLYFPVFLRIRNLPSPVSRSQAHTHLLVPAAHFCVRVLHRCFTHPESRGGRSAEKRSGACEAPVGPALGASQDARERAYDAAGQAPSEAPCVP